MRINNLYSFVEKSNQFHKNKYDYSKFNYINAKTKSIIICPEHGDFLQKPDHHLRKNAIGCPGCVVKNKILTVNKPSFKIPKREQLSFENFEKRAIEKFGTKFFYYKEDYRQLTGNKIRIICPNHGEFLSAPNNHLITSTGCPKCGRQKSSNTMTKSYDDFLIQVNIKYNNKYIYPEDNRIIYKNKRSKVKIICPEHGEFVLMAQKHLSKSECFHCRINQLIKEGKLPGGYTSDLIQKNPEFVKKEAVLYYLEIDDNIFKIGITTNLKKRIKDIKSKSKKNVNLLFSVNMSLKNAILKEIEILKCFAECRIYKNFSTELFSEDISQFEKFSKILNN
jgi:hypothetical protein